jgi:hypothetical protein
MRTRARDPALSRWLLRRADFLQQNCAIQRNAVRIALALLSSEKHAAQRREKLRKHRSLNYKSAALSHKAAWEIKFGRADIIKRFLASRRSGFYFAVAAKRADG